MNNRFSIGELLTEIKYTLTAGYERGSGQDDQAVSAKASAGIAVINMKRIFMVSFLAAAAGICFIFLSGGEEKDSGSEFLKMLGSLMMILDSAVFMWLSSKELSRRTYDHRVMKVMFYIYWLTFIVSNVLVSVSEKMSGGVVISFWFMIAAVTAVPVVSLFESIFVTVIMLTLFVTGGVMFSLPALYYIISVLGVFAYVWIQADRRKGAALPFVTEEKLGIYESRAHAAKHTDMMTGLLNKAGLSRKFSELIAPSSPVKDITVALVDIDDFRSFNHLYGYSKSDECLSAVCKYINIAAKPYTDLVSRFGGDEFVIIFKDMDELQVVKLCEQLRQNIERMALKFGDGVVTVSIGISQTKHLEGRQTYSKLLNEADDQLLIAKNNGRNCIGFRGRPFIHENRKNPQ